MAEEVRYQRLTPEGFGLELMRRKRVTGHCSSTHSLRVAPTGAGGRRGAGRAEAAGTHMLEVRGCPADLQVEVDAVLEVLANEWSSLELFVNDRHGPRRDLSDVSLPPIPRVRVGLGLC